jgi:signal transduction histidine kinase
VPLSNSRDTSLRTSHDRLRRHLLIIALVTCCAIAAPSEAAQALDGQNQKLVAGAAAILLAQAALIAGLLVQRSRRRHAEEQLRSREAELRTSYDRIRDIGRRLLTAQEAERARIARELHDDLSQQLVLLRLDLRHAGNNEETLDRVDEIARSVHELSHRLHPAKLQLLGLVPSLQALQREKSRSGIAVALTHGDIPAGLSPALTLCLFRVVQEALQNAIKYSQATQVLVDLQCDDADLTLTIADDGVGFDLETAWGKGLGLISIRERVEASGGVVTIRSKAGDGTRVDVRVPLAVEPAVWSPSSHPAPLEPEPEPGRLLHSREIAPLRFSSSSFAPERAFASELT